MDFHTFINLILNNILQIYIFNFFIFLFFKLYYINQIHILKREHVQDMKNLIDYYEILTNKYKQKIIKNEIKIKKIEEEINKIYKFTNK